MLHPIPTDLDMGSNPHERYEIVEFSNKNINIRTARKSDQRFLQFLRSVFAFVCLKFGVFRMFITILLPFGIASLLQWELKNVCGTPLKRRAQRNMKCVNPSTEDVIKESRTERRQRTY